MTINNALAPAADVSCVMQQKLNVRQRLERLVDELRADRNPTDKALLDRVKACGVAWDGRYLCRTPACFRCREINIRKQQRETFNLLSHFSNYELAWVTVVLGATSNIKGLTPLIAKSRQDTRNCFVAARRRDPRWHDTYLRAWHEIDAVGADHLPILPPDRKRLIPALAPMAAQTLDATWIPTWHGLMFRNGLSDNEIKCQLSRQWKLDHQVDVQTLDPVKTLAANLKTLSGYPNKFHTTVTLESEKGPIDDPWPVSWEAKFFGWINAAQRNPFESIRMTIQQFVPMPVAEIPDSIECLSPMPFTYSFTRVPMYNNTGALA